MQIAKIKDNKVEAVGEHMTLFPNVSFPTSGPTSDWMSENSVMPVTIFRPYNGLTEKSTSVDPYIEDGVVYLHKIEALDDSQKAAAKTATAPALQRTSMPPPGSRHGAQSANPSSAPPRPEQMPPCSVG